MPRDAMEPDDYDAAPAKREDNKKIVAGILAIMLGGLGVHKFYLGMTTAGIIELILGVCTGLGFVLGIIEGIIYLTKSDEDFYQTYQVEKKAWF
jgi:TM2 domain-containing membrane protein YozV